MAVKSVCGWSGKNFSLALRASYLDVTTHVLNDAANEPALQRREGGVLTFCRHVCLDAVSKQVRADVFGKIGRLCEGDVEFVMMGRAAGVDEICERPT
jgi:hypothetical protein